jgi:hypothetical protein
MGDGGRDGVDEPVQPGSLLDEAAVMATQRVDPIAAPSRTAAIVGRSTPSSRSSRISCRRNNSACS